MPGQDFGSRLNGADGVLGGPICAIARYSPPFLRAGFPLMQDPRAYRSTRDARSGPVHNNPEGFTPYGGRSVPRRRQLLYIVSAFTPASEVVDVLRQWNRAILSSGDTARVWKLALHISIAFNTASEKLLQERHPVVLKCAQIDDGRDGRPRTHRDVGRAGPSGKSGGQAG